VLVLRGEALEVTCEDVDRVEMRWMVRMLEMDAYSVVESCKMKEHWYLNLRHSEVFGHILLAGNVQPIYIGDIRIINIMLEPKYTHVSARSRVSLNTAVTPLTACKLS